MTIIGLKLLLVIACASTLLEHVSARRKVFQDDDVFLPNGRPAQVSVMSDDNCTRMEDLTTTDNGNTSNVLKDFESGKSALILSNEPDVCYIRSLDEKFRRRHRCMDGMLMIKPDEFQPGSRTYADGKELNATDLSSELAEFCGDRRIVELVVSRKSGHRGSRACIDNTKKVCENVLCCCQEVCTRYGWLFRANKCLRTENRCSTTEKCVTEIEKIGCR